MFIGPIAVTDFDTIIGVIAVVAWLILQAVAKSRKNDRSASPPPPPPGQAGEPVSPQDDLRRFFEELEKNLNQSSRPAAPAQPPGLPPAIPPPARVTRPAPRVTAAAQHSRPAASPRPAPAAAVVPQAKEPVAPITAAPEPQEFKWDLPHEPSPAPAMAAGLVAPPVAASSAQGRRTRHFRSRDAMRQAVIGSEILGKPLALR